MVFKKKFNFFALLFVFALIGLGLLGYQLYNMDKDYKDLNNEYEKVETELKSSKKDKTSTTQKTTSNDYIIYNGYKINILDSNNIKSVSGDALYYESKEFNAYITIDTVEKYASKKLKKDTIKSELELKKYEVEKYGYPYENKYRIFNPEYAEINSKQCKVCKDQRPSFVHQDSPSARRLRGDRCERGDHG